MGIEAIEADDRRAWRRFLEFPLLHYKGDPNFVPHLIAERKEFFSRKNPLFEFTEVRYFLAYGKGGRVAGRLSAHVNHRHNEFHGERAGFFGFFESVNDVEVARALLASAEEWLRGKGMSVIRGPSNFSTNEECGLLIDCFDQPPVFMMPYNKRYYPALMAAIGYRKAKDLLAYDYRTPPRIPEFLERLAARARSRTGLDVRAMEQGSFEQDVARAFRVYNCAWEKNWGFVPMTEAQFEYTAHSLKSVIDLRLALIAEKDGEPVGFSLMLPNYNVLLRRMHGRLFPFGIMYLLFGKSLIDSARLVTLGVVEKYRKMGVDALLIYETFRNGMAVGYRRGEFSWVLEDNVMMRRFLDRLGAVHYKTYRIYEKTL